MPSPPPPTFTLCVRHVDGNIYQLSTAQILPVPRKQAFAFFEDPRNLFDITPDWLEFVMKNRETKTEVFEGAEFDYTIRWYGVSLRWKSRITGYQPPDQFTDVQLVGPYRSWRHLHTFKEVPEGTLMQDSVIYELPFGLFGKMVHAVIVKRQLEDIFRYRATRIDEWTRGVFEKEAAEN